MADLSPVGNHSPAENSDSPVVVEEDTEIPPHLFQAGWRQAWSKRLNRYYFYNPAWPNKTYWHIKDILADIGEGSDAGGSTPSGGSNSHDSPAPTPVNTTTTNSATTPTGNAQPCPIGRPEENKKPFRHKVPSNEYEFELPSNVLVKTEISYQFVPPCPAADVLRKRSFNKIYEKLAILIDQNMFGFEIPTDTLLILLCDVCKCNISSEPLYPVNAGQHLESLALKRHLVERFFDPPDVNSPTTIKDSIKFVDRLKRFLENSKSESWKNEYLQASNSALKALQTTNAGRDSDAWKKYFKLLQKRKPSMRKLLTSLAEAVAREIHKFALFEAQDLDHKCRGICADSGMDPEMMMDPEPDPEEPVTCHACVLRIPTPRLNKGHHEQDPLNVNDVHIHCLFEPLYINAEYFYKLESLYGLSCVDDGCGQLYDMFQARAWCLLKRYDCLPPQDAASGDVGVKPGVSSYFHVSLPVATFQRLREELDVSFECFSSPLNTYFKHYCSMFPDIDGFFGSRGSFFDFKPVAGSLVAFPPFNDEILDQCFNHMTECLKNTALPLSFVLVVPDPKLSDRRHSLDQEYLTSPFFRTSVDIQREICWVRDGSQHLKLRTERRIKLPFGLKLYVFQNDAGLEEYPCLDPGKMLRLRLSFCASVQPPPDIDPH